MTTNNLIFWKIYMIFHLNKNKNNNKVLLIQVKRLYNLNNRFYRNLKQNTNSQFKKNKKKQIK